MLVVVAALEDDAALWFVRAATARGVPCTVLTTQALSFPRRLSHSLSDDGFATRIELTDGTVVDSGAVDGVLNRLVEAPSMAWRSAAAGERDYAAAELHALTVSWLHALPCPVRNRPAPDCLAGRLLHPFAAAAAATAAGLSCPPLQIGTGWSGEPAMALQLAAVARAGAGAQVRRLVCLDGAVLAEDVPEDQCVAIKRFTTSAGLHDALVGMDFLVAGGRWWFAGATPLPELRLGGPLLVDGLLALFGAVPQMPAL